jgi:hypothetical protein
VTLTPGPQELQNLIDEANQSLEESGTPSHEIMVIVLHREYTQGGSIGVTLAGGADYESKEITVATPRSWPDGLTLTATGPQGDSRQSGGQGRQDTEGRQGPLHQREEHQGGQPQGGAQHSQGKQRQRL